MDSKITSLIINIVVAIIAITGVILVFYAMGYAPEIDPETEQDIADTSAVSNVVTFSLWTLYISLGVIGIFTIFAIATNPKRFIPTAIGIGIFAVLVLVGYAMVNVETTGDIMKLEGATEGNLLMGGLGIKTTYVLVIVAIGLILAQGVRNLVGYFSK
ncbi:MAG: hypothetical protein GQ574_27810 [Crocinitomix sp.]|nr:hypothetical protein [Crocinitomix sp.]